MSDSDDAVKKWLEYRKKNPPEDPKVVEQRAVREWLEYRKKLEAMSPAERAAYEDEERRKAKSKKGGDDDGYGLEYEHRRKD